MTIFHLGCHNGRLYLKDEIQTLLGVKKEKRDTVRVLANAKTAVLISKKATWSDALESLDLLRRDIELRMKTDGH